MHTHPLNYIHACSPERAKRHLVKLQSFISAFILHTPSDVETETSRWCFSPIPTLRAISPVKIKASASTSSFPTLQSDRGGWRAIGEPLYLEDVFAGSYVCNVDPLAVNVMAVGVPAANGDTLLSHVVAGEALLDTWKIQLESDKEETSCDFIYTFIIFVYQMFYF